MLQGLLLSDNSRVGLRPYTKYMKLLFLSDAKQTRGITREGEYRY